VAVFDIFLSHNSADKPAVEEIAHKLKDAGVEPWLDKWCLVPGKTFQAGRSLQKRRSKSLLVGVPSVHGIERQWGYLMHQIGDLWKEWTSDEIEAFTSYIAPIVEFDRKLRDKRDDLT
jgi:hypothetical protein